MYGWFGQNNVGDDAILWNLSSEIRRRFPDVRFKILARGGCSLPEDVRRQSVLVNLSFFDPIRTDQFEGSGICWEKAHI
jgi:polysaccharide pyruvyl transferase WcaK-like protein